MSNQNDNSPKGTIASSRLEAFAFSAEFYDGNPCHLGHGRIRYSLSGRCVQCEKDQSYSERKAEYRNSNREKHRADTAAYYLANKEKIRERKAKYHKENSAILTANKNRRRARRNNADGSHTHLDAAAIRLSQKDKCAVCRVKLKKGGHLDHIQPLSKGGSNFPRNLQWLCQPCNNEKHAKDPIDFMREKGLLL